MSHTVRKQFQLGKYFLKNMYPPQKKCEGRPGVLLDQRWFGCRFSIIRMDEGGGGGMNVWTLCVSALWGKKKKRKNQKGFSKIFV